MCVKFQLSVSESSRDIKGIVLPAGSVRVQMKAWHIWPRFRFSESVSTLAAYGGLDTLWLHRCIRLGKRVSKSFELFLSFFLFHHVNWWLICTRLCCVHTRLAVEDSLWQRQYRQRQWRWSWRNVNTDSRNSAWSVCWAIAGRRFVFCVHHY